MRPGLLRTRWNQYIGRYNASPAWSVHLRANACLNKGKSRAVAPGSSTSTGDALPAHTPRSDRHLEDPTSRLAFPHGWPAAGHRPDRDLPNSLPRQCSNPASEAISGELSLSSRKLWLAWSTGSLRAAMHPKRYSNNVFVDGWLRGFRCVPRGRHALKHSSRNRSGAITVIASQPCS